MALKHARVSKKIMKAAILFSCVTLVSAAIDNSKACKAWDKLIKNWSAGNFVDAASAMADGVKITYGKNMAPYTPGLKDFGTQTLSQSKAAAFLQSVAEAYDFYDVGNHIV